MKNVYQNDTSQLKKKGFWRSKDEWDGQNFLSVVFPLLDVSPNSLNYTYQVLNRVLLKTFAVKIFSTIIYNWPEESKLLGGKALELKKKIHCDGRVRTKLWWTKSILLYISFIAGEEEKLVSMGLWVTVLESNNFFEV